MCFCFWADDRKKVRGNMIGRWKIWECPRYTGLPERTCIADRVIEFINPNVNPAGYAILIGPATDKKSVVMGRIAAWINGSCDVARRRMNIIKDNVILRTVWGKNRYKLY